MSEPRIPPPLEGDTTPQIPSPLGGERARERGSRQVRLTFRRNLRNNGTDAEKVLWFHIRADQLGVRFRRQYQIGPYIADFFCHSRNLVVELDGGQHYEPPGITTDQLRDAYMHQRGIAILRFNNLDVLERTDGVVEAIMAALDPLPSPLPREGEGT